MTIFRGDRSFGHRLQVLVLGGLFSAATLATPHDPAGAEIQAAGGQLDQKSAALPNATATNTCTADIEIDYEQRGDALHVLTRVTGPDCPDAHGTYIVRASTQDAATNIATSRFEERWQINDDSLFVNRHIYPMDGAADLLSVRASTNDCVCENAP